MVDKDTVWLFTDSIKCSWLTITLACRYGEAAEALQTNKQSFDIVQYKALWVAFKFIRTNCVHFRICSNLTALRDKTSNLHTCRSVLFLTPHICRSQGITVWYPPSPHDVRFNAFICSHLCSLPLELKGNSKEEKSVALWRTAAVVCLDSHSVTVDPNGKIATAGNMSKCNRTSIGTSQILPVA